MVLKNLKWRLVIVDSLTWDRGLSFFKLVEDHNGWYPSNFQHIPLESLECITHMEWVNLWNAEMEFDTDRARFPAVINASDGPSTQ